MKILLRVSLFIAIPIFSLFYFTTIASLAGSGEKIVELKTEISKLERDNRSLLIALNDQSYIAEIEQKAKGKGLVFDPKIVYVKIPSSLAVSKR